MMGGGGGGGIGFSHTNIVRSTIDTFSVLASKAITCIRLDVVVTE